MNTKIQLLVFGLILLSISTYAQRYDQGIGIRVGDPLALTYKTYGSRNTALEFTVGSTSRNRHGSYYRDAFDRVGDFDNFRYSNHNVKYTLALQGRYLVHYAFPANVEGRLDWYWGVGAQVRVSSLDYSFFDESDILRTDRRTNFDFGPEGILGVEYELQDYPIVGFSEVSIMGEIVDQPLRLRIFGAIGVRYAF
ncbi:MAG: hypothetical protein AAFN93_03095 [Bacteroidota bacterium]